jgi:hypothetical protein
MNEVRISGPYSEVHDMLTKCGYYSNQEFKMNGFIPMPDEVRNTTSPMPKTKEQILAEAKKHNWFESEVNSALSYAITSEEAERYNENYRKYGAYDWYDWAMKYWGVKWDLSDVTWVEVELPDPGDAKPTDDATFTINFDTAWGPPDMFYHFLSYNYPNCHISWFYHEPGMEFAGYLNNE